MKFTLYKKDIGPREDFDDEVDIVFTDSERAAHYIYARIKHQWIVRVVYTADQRQGDGMTVDFESRQWGVRKIKRVLDSMHLGIEEL